MQLCILYCNSKRNHLTRKKKNKQLPNSNTNFALVNKANKVPQHVQCTLHHSVHRNFVTINRNRIYCPG